MIVLLLTALIGSAVDAAELIHLDENRQNLSASVDVAFDATGMVAAEDAAVLSFHQNSDDAIFFRQGPGTYWLRFAISNNAYEQQSRWVTIDYAHVRRFALFQNSAGQVNLVSVSGADFALADRATVSLMPAVRADIGASTTVEFLLQVEIAGKPQNHAITLLSDGSLLSSQLSIAIAYAVLLGGVFALLIYNLALYRSLKLRRFLFYCLSCTWLILAIVRYQGFLYFFPAVFSVDAVQSPAFTLLLGVLFAFPVLFLRDILDLESVAPMLGRIFIALAVFPVISITALLLVENIWLSQLTSLFYLVPFVLAIAITPRCLAAGNRAAKYVAIGSAVIIATSVFETVGYLLLPAQSAIPVAISSDIVRTYVYFGGIGVDMLFNSLALSTFVAQIRDEKDEAQQQALLQLEESNRLKDSYASDLELAIEQRTAEISKQSEQLLKQANELRDLDELKTRFFTNVSHDLRTPLTLIGSPIQDLSSGRFGELSDDAKMALEMCGRNVERLARQIDELLLLSRLDNEGVRLEARPTDINNLCRRCAGLFVHTAADRGIDLQVSVSEEPAVIYADAAKLEKVICNLLSNAFKFVPNDGQVVVEVVESQNDKFIDDDFLTVVVEDSGEGVPVGEEVRVFDRFYRSAPTSSSDGSGIGLSLVKELVELHGGEIVCEAGKNGRYSRFRMLLPHGIDHLAVDELSSAPPLNETREESRSSDAGKSVVLLVEDDADMRTYLAELFAADYEVRTAVDGEDAENIVGQTQIDVVVSDIMMPRKDGIQLVESIRDKQETEHLPVLLLTAKASDEARLQGLTALADDYLAKPFNSEELKLRVATLLRRVESRNDEQAVRLAQTLPIDDAEESQILTQARQIILRNVEDPGFGSEALAKAMYMSLSTLQRRMSEEGGPTPARFIKLVRLTKAHELLESKVTKTYAAAAAAVGFSHAGYFAKLYKKFQGEMGEQVV